MATQATRTAVVVTTHPGHDALDVVMDSPDIDIAIFESPATAFARIARTAIGGHHQPVVRQRDRVSPPDAAQARSRDRINPDLDVRRPARRDRHRTDRFRPGGRDMLLFELFPAFITLVCAVIGVELVMANRCGGVPLARRESASSPAGSS